MDLIASASNVRQLLAYLDAIGLDERRLRVGPIDPRLRRTQGPLRVSARLIIDLLEAAAKETGQSDFGLRYGMWLNLRGLDAISLLWDQAGSIATWYHLAQRYVHLENNALRYDLVRDGEEVALIHDIVAVLQPRATQTTYAFVALTTRVFHEVIGPGWCPLRVELRCAQPADVSLMRKFFKCPIVFEAPHNAIHVRARDFERELPGRRPEMLIFFEDFLRRQDFSWSPNLDTNVEQILMAELAGGTPTLPHVASRLAMSPRTLQRQLAVRGTSFGALLTKVRLEIVESRMSRRPRVSLAQLAYDLGLSDPTAVSRFLRSKRQ